MAERQDRQALLGSAVQGASAGGVYLAALCLTGVRCFLSSRGGAYQGKASPYSSAAS